MGPWGAAGLLPSPSGDHPAWPELTAALDWLPLASLLLAADGAALAVSREWSALSGLAAEDSRADGWISAVEPLDRGMLRARLRDAAAAGQAGHADVLLAGRPAGRWSRWWWRPGPSGRLIVCVADLGGFRDRDDQWQGDRRPPARLVRRGEFVNLAGRALRRGSHHGEHVAVVAIRLNGITGLGSGAGPAGDLLGAAAERISAVAGPAGAAAQVAPGEFVILLDGLRAPGDAGIIASRIRAAVSQPLEVDGTPVQVTAVTGVAVADRSGRSAGELIDRASSAAQPGSHAAGADPPGPRPAAIGPAGQTWPAVAGMLVHRLFGVGLAVQSASALANGALAARLRQVLDQLNAIIEDTRATAFESQVPQHYHGGED